MHSTLCITDTRVNTMGKNAQWSDQNPSGHVNPTSKYYDDLAKWYKRRYSPDHMHIGFWDENTKTHEEALVNTASTVVDLLEIVEGDIVLDAGCGIGGTSRYIVNKFQVQTTGINLSKNLLSEATRLNTTFKYRHLLDFYYMDYTNTTFNDGSFSKIFSLESLCHEKQKQLFLQEANRLLKHDGKLIVCDAFRTKKVLSTIEKKLYDKTLGGWLIPNLPTVNEFLDMLKKEGFEKITYHNKIDQIRTSSNRMYKASRLYRPITYILSKLRIWSKSIHMGASAAYYQKQCIDRDIITYGIFEVEK